MATGWLITLGYISGYSAGRVEAEQIFYDLAHEGIVRIGEIGAGLNQLSLLAKTEDRHE